MKVFRGFVALPTLVRPAVTVGSFDGVHLGHRALIDRLIAEARAVEGQSVVVTFDPHPRVALGRDDGLRLLTSLDRKIDLLAAAGVDVTVVVPFDRAFSALSGDAFVRDYLVDRIGAQTLVAGFNHRFGHDRVAAPSLHIPGLRIVQVDECRIGDDSVSSTVIRRLLDEGRIAEAERLLGYPPDRL